jgi:2-polyprenyl-3-methyl-5-hydroxy-6-metoxy-1,4-benzoquinol methylase
MNNQGDRTLADLYDRKDDSYFTNARRDYVDALPAGGELAILELGCGNGATGALAIEQGKCRNYVGIELFVPMAREAERVLTKVHIGDVNSIELPYPADHFDVLIMSEVLEHLVNPEQAVQKLARLIKPDGLLFASTPNISHWRMIKSLIGGDFTYTTSGMMDESHVHWFTPNTFARLFAQAGFRPVMVGAIGGGGKLTSILPRKLQHLGIAQINYHGIKTRGAGSPVPE